MLQNGMLVQSLDMRVLIKETNYQHSSTRLQVNGNLVSPMHVLANAEVVEIVTYDVSIYDSCDSFPSMYVYFLLGLKSDVTISVCMLYFN